MICSGGYKEALDTDTEGSKGLKDLMALGCSVPSKARALQKGQRVPKNLIGNSWLPEILFIP